MCCLDVRPRHEPHRLREGAAGEHAERGLQRVERGAGRPDPEAVREEHPEVRLVEGDPVVHEGGELLSDQAAGEEGGSGAEDGNREGGKEGGGKGSGEWMPAAWAARGTMHFVAPIIVVLR